MSSQTADLRSAVLKALAYFDIFDYPLTLVEVHKWLYQPSSVYSLAEVLVALGKTAEIEERFGFYFLVGRGSIVASRLKRYKISEKKFTIASRVAGWLSRLNFVKMIAVCNNAGYNNAAAPSDIDFFIVAAKGRLWQARLAAIIITTILGVRRRGDQVTNRICLSFYLADHHLNLSDVGLLPNDPYLTYWLATLSPIYGQETYSTLLAANGWLKNFLPNFYPNFLTNRRYLPPAQYMAFPRSLSDALESLAKAAQIKKIKQYFGSEINSSDHSVVISDQMLKLHKVDRREMYQKIWQQKLVSLKLYD